VKRKTYRKHPWGVKLISMDEADEYDIDAGYRMEYRMPTKMMTPSYLTCLQKQFPYVRFDPIHQMIVVVSADNARARMCNVLEDRYLSILKNEEIDEFVRMNITQVQYPCDANIIRLYPTERDIIRQIMNDPILGKILIDSGRWYQIYDIPTVTIVPMKPVTVNQTNNNYRNNPQKCVTQNYSIYALYIFIWGFVCRIIDRVV